MFFTLRMFQELLKEFEPEMHFNGIINRSIENIRLYSPNEERRKNILYIEKSDVIFQDKKDQVVCMHENNYFLLNTTNTNLIFNTVLNFFEEKQAWSYQLSTMISNNCLLKDVLSQFKDMLPFPLMVLDASQTVLAFSENYGFNTLDSRWNHMILTGSFGVEIIQEYNRLYRHLIPKKDPYYVPNDPFPFRSYNQNIYLSDEFMGFISLIVTEDDLTENQNDWFLVACEYILNWFSLYANQNEILMMKSIFEELLTNNYENIDRFLNTLNTFGWQKNAVKRVVTLTCISNILNMNQHIEKLINQKSDSMYAIDFQNDIVILVNESQLPYEKMLELILPIVQNSGYYGGSSNTFSKLTDLPHYYMQATLPLKYGTANPGTIHSCQEYILPYSFQLLKNNTHMDLCHPALQTLKDYDAHHRSGYYDLLYLFLQNECNQTLSAQAANMHRTSLIRKMHHIQELAQLDLDDYHTRFHLLFSFEYERIITNP